jgi:hypothetical protein
MKYYSASVRFQNTVPFTGLVLRIWNLHFSYSKNDPWIHQWYISCQFSWQFFTNAVWFITKHIMPHRVQRDTPWAFVYMQHAELRLLKQMYLQFWPSVNDGKCPEMWWLYSYFIVTNIQILINF